MYDGSSLAPEAKNRSQLVSDPTIHRHRVRIEGEANGSKLRRRRRRERPILSGNPHVESFASDATKVEVRVGSRLEEVRQTVPLSEVAQEREGMAPCMCEPGRTEDVGDGVL